MDECQNFEKGTAENGRKKFRSYNEVENQQTDRMDYVRKFVILLWRSKNSKSPLATSHLFIIFLLTQDNRLRLNWIIITFAFFSFYNFIGTINRFVWSCLSLNYLRLVEAQSVVSSEQKDDGWKAARGYFQCFLSVRAEHITNLLHSFGDCQPCCMNKTSCNHSSQ